LGHLPFGQTVEENKDIIFPLADAVDRILRTKFEREINNVKERRFDVSIETIEVIELMVHKDLTEREVAKILGCHVQTVNRRVAAGKKATGTHTVPALWNLLVKVGLSSTYTGAT